jgi:hypothetical protein
VLFVLAAQPESLSWSVRQFADAAGVSKSNAAKIRNQLVTEGFLLRRKQGFSVYDEKELHEQLVRGYDQVLRPKMTIGRFRVRETDQKFVLENFARVFGESGTTWSVTGEPAAFRLQHYLKGIEIPVFVDRLADNKS